MPVEAETDTLPAANAMPAYAVVLTAYCWDDFLDRQYRENAAYVKSGDMHVLLDESRGPIDIPAEFKKTSATTEAAEGLGLRISYEKALFWHNLDYLYYIFVVAHPEYDYYVFLDYDARLLVDVDAMIGKIHRSRIDFVGEAVVDNIDDWVYLPQHIGTYPRNTIEAAISAVTVLSRDAIRYLLERRRHMTRVLPAESGYWPFCEAVVPTELKLGGFRSASLAAYGNTDNFAWWPPLLEDALPSLNKPCFLHPVLDRPRFVKSMLNHSRWLDFVSPRGRLWAAVRSCVDRRWLGAGAAEIVKRSRRRVQRIFRRPPSGVGMSWMK